MKKFSLTLTTTALFMASLNFASALSIDNIDQNNKVLLTMDMNDQRFAITGACNTLVGSFSIMENGIFKTNLNQLASTMMMCDDESEALNKRVQNFLAHSPKIVKKDSELFLVSSIENEANSLYLPIYLEAGSYEDIAAIPYKTVFVYVASEQKDCTDKPDEKCLDIRYDKNDEWTQTAQKIEGFTPEAGIEYFLRVKEYGENDDKKWVLDLVVGQNVINPQS